MAPRNKRKHDAPAQPPPALPNWPAFDPLVPQADLALQELLPAHVVAGPSLWTATLCRNFVSFLRTLPLATTPGRSKRGNAVRVNDRFQVHDPAFAARLWSETALRNLITGGVGAGGLDLTASQRSDLWGGEVIGLNPNIRIYRYSKGQFFDQHYDDSNSVTIPGPPSIPARTAWTLLLYLTSASNGCIGGETVFYPEPPNKKSKDLPARPFVVELETGLALLHRHGADCMLHEGREVLDDVVRAAGAATAEVCALLWPKKNFGAKSAR